jgi:hypothetical protein
MLSGADLPEPFSRQLRVDGANNALVQEFVLQRMAARPGICFEVREVCLAVIVGDFLRRGFADLGGKFPVSVCLFVASVVPPSWQVTVSRRAGCAF